MRGCLCGHLELGMPLPKATLMPLVHGIMLLKTIEARSGPSAWRLGLRA